MAKPERRKSKPFIEEGKMKKKQKKRKRRVIESKQLKDFLKHKQIVLDCGHKASIGHNFSNTLIVLSDGTTLCHSCYD
jgi:hypothetical protein